MSSCSASNGVQVSQGVTIPSSLAVPAACVLKIVPGGELLPASGVTVTINGSIQAPQTQQIFGGAGSIAGLMGDIPVEWFGAVSNNSLTSGTDSTAAIQATINSLTSGHAFLSQGAYYHVSSALQITKTATGIMGVKGGSSYPNSAPVSALVSSSSTADIVDVVAGVWWVYGDRG